MNIKILSVLGLVLLNQIISGQEKKFYATTDKKSAKELKLKFPDQIDIIAITNENAAVYIDKLAAEFLHKNVVTHGPGYVYKSSEQDALSAINVINKAEKVLSFTITEDVLVKEAIAKVREQNIKNHIKVLEDYGTRHHATAKAKESVQDLKEKWEGLISVTGRNDLSVRIVNHDNTTMPSLVFTINGNVSPEQYIIVGGHMDTISNVSLAPGADDDASGIATITEMLRVLLELNYKPAKTVEFMAFAAEEVGLVGSSEIAGQYAEDNKDVISYVQFDMTNYKGSVQDVYLTTDSYNNNTLNLFLIELMEYYNKTGDHAFTYGSTVCSYGCSDHFSWAQNGFAAAFPFESRFADANPNIHRSTDTLASMGNNAVHAVKFAKLGLEFIIETAKTSSLSVNDINDNFVEVYINQKVLNYKLNNEQIESVSILDVSGRTLLENKRNLSLGKLDLTKLNSGFYLALFKTKSGKLLTKKFILE